MIQTEKGGSIRRWVFRLARAAAVAYLLVLLAAMFFEESLIFLPSPYPEGDWQPVALEVEDAHFTAADGAKLHGWYLPHPNPTAHVLFLHGNAGNVTHRDIPLRQLNHFVGAAVLIVDYRGYGKSEGRPNEAGVLQDARAARTWLAERAGVAESELVLLGESLGGGVAVDLAAEKGARALVLQNTFSSLPDAAAAHFPFLPTRLVMRTRLDSVRKIVDYDGPLHQTHGTADQTVPFALGKKLFDAAPSARKRFLQRAGAGHNELLLDSYYEDLREFLTEQTGD